MKWAIYNITLAVRKHEMERAFCNNEMYASVGCYKMLKTVVASYIKIIV